ncbi:Ribokinase [Trema orientale]|uniref:Ribokinase n=1 Tax=Trema orientale TaxID=63057 RepID=A0A2P5C0Q1_TREOI|nr:Ribokinase [Trema orientale]
MSNLVFRTKNITEDFKCLLELHTSNKVPLPHHYDHHHHLNLNLNLNLNLTSLLLIFVRISWICDPTYPHCCLHLLLLSPRVLGSRSSLSSTSRELKPKPSSVMRSFSLAREPGSGARRRRMLDRKPRNLRSFSADELELARSILMSLSFGSSKFSKTTVLESSLAPSTAPAPSPIYQGPIGSLPPRHIHRRHRHHARPRAVAPAPSKDQEPLTATPFGSPCGCVFPMKVRLLLDVAPFAVFPVMNELEIEVAAGTYLEQSQVKIMGASADSQNQGKTIVDINLVPLGEKFDNTTAILTYQRFRHKKVPLNMTLFGNYEVIYISYPGIPSSPPYGSFMGSGPTASAGNLPITANFGNKNQKMNVRTIAIIALSAFVLLMVLLGAVSIFIKWRKVGKPSGVVGPAFTSSIHKRSGIGSILSSSIASSTSVSLISTMAPSILSVRTFSLSELEKATDKFSSQRILGEGGFGRVYSGLMEDGTEAAVKLLTRDNQNGDREFIAEVEMLSRLHHRNLVKLIGICIEGRKRCLVYELVPNGSVESHLHGTYVAPEYAMTGHLLVKSDVYSYGVVLLELLSGRKPVDMSQPQGQENLVTWARPLLTNREGLEQLVDPALAGCCDFDDMAKVAAIASMCVHPEVTHRPFMGEVVQALKLIYNDTDETCGDCCSQKESSAPDSDFKGDLAVSDGSWWNAGGISPRLTYGQASSFITMEYSSGQLEEMDNRPFSTSSLIGDEISLPVRHGNRSGPLRTVRSKPAFYRLTGSRSEHGAFLPRRAWNDGYWAKNEHLTGPKHSQLKPINIIDPCHSLGTGLMKEEIFRFNMSSNSLPIPENRIVVGVGAAAVDFLATVASYPKPDDKIRSTSLKVQGGGNAGNALTCASRLGLSPRLVSKVADDSQGRSILDELEADGVDTSFFVVAKDGNSPFTYIIVDNQTKTRTCIHTPGYPPMKPDELSQSSIVSLVDGARIVYFDGRLHETALLVAQEAASKNIPILVDAERVREGLDDLLELTEYLAWTGAPSVPSALVSLLLRLPKLKFVIVTLGEDGCVMLERSVKEDSQKEVDVDSLLESLKQRKDDRLVFPTYISSSVAKITANGIGTVSGRLLLGTAEKIPPSELIDSTGAGDSFIGAVLYALCADMPVEKMLPFATQVAAACCRALGARTGLPHRTDPRLTPFFESERRGDPTFAK